MRYCFNKKLHFWKKSAKGTSVYVMLTNESSFHSASIIEIGLSDCHKLIVSFFFELISTEFQQKQSNIENLRTLARLEFFMILIKNRLKKYYKYSNDHYSAKTKSEVNMYPL